LGDDIDPREYPIGILDGYSKEKCLKESYKWVEDITNMIIPGAYKSNFVAGQCMHVVARISDCTLAGGVWTTYRSNFDNIVNSMMTLIEMATTEGWAEVMDHGTAMTGVGLQPIVNGAEGYLLFFIFYIIVGNFFVLNLFVGVVIDNFNEMKEILSGTSMLSEEQKQWIEIHKLFLKTGPERMIDPPLGWQKQV
jgi:hypothetical protein